MVEAVEAFVGEVVMVADEVEVEGFGSFVSIFELSESVKDELASLACPWLSFGT